MGIEGKTRGAEGQGPDVVGHPEFSKVFGRLKRYGLPEPTEELKQALHFAEQEARPGSGVLGLNHLALGLLLHSPEVMSKVKNHYPSFSKKEAQRIFGNGGFTQSLSLERITVDSEVTDIIFTCAEQANGKNEKELSPLDLFYAVLKTGNTRIIEFRREFPLSS